MNISRARRVGLLACALLVLPLLLTTSCGGVAACVGWWCVGVGPCYPYCYSSWDTAYGDFNGDGTIDTASGNPGESMVVVRTATGPESFSDGTVVMPATGGGVDFIRSGNFSNDMNLDLVVIDAGAGQVRTHLGDGTGAFPNQGAPFSLMTAAPIRRVLVGAVDGDAFDDVVLFDFDGGVLVLICDGAGSFAPGAAGRVAFGSGAVALAVGLLNGDGMLDLAVLDTAAGTLSVYTGTGTGAWTLIAGPIAIGSAPTAAAIGEFNGMPGLDLAVAWGAPAFVRIYFGDGAGAFTPSPQGPIPLTTSNVTQLHALPDATAPMGPADLVAANDVYLVGLPNLGTGTFGTAGGVVRTTGIRKIFPVDLNGDASMDLLFTQLAGSGVGLAIGGTRQR